MCLSSGFLSLFRPSSPDPINPFLVRQFGCFLDFSVVSCDFLLFSGDSGWFRRVGWLCSGVSFWGL